MIRGLAVDGSKTVGELIAEMHDNLKVDMSVNDPRVGGLITRHAEIREKLQTAGVMTVTADPELELSVRLYGIVFDSAKLEKAMPAIKPFEAVVDNLTF